ncbi:PPE family protein [Mycobacterium sp. 1423905.2]|uniref:PPE family protein n=1 Tax=Mycobacterium sp. 1423905.2 TaxID=1856859 RepID=UPI0007FC1C26|nr:PPE family protein [Mycobacterium sp. 1423905.2]OBJ55148.1 hypothetical protein A9W95_15480 [Mycobacterium sp. 1423905.2]
MNALPDFGLLPPEVNSARMYSGVGSAPLVAAAAAWETLATELHSLALSYSSVIFELADQWHGSSSAQMVAAAAPYAAWIDTTAAQAEQAAAQAGAAATAFAAAFAATVPPAVVAANRSLLMSLIATNILGQNTPAIAAAELEYGEMWEQDAAAMYGYAADSAAATALTAFTPPPQTTNPAGQVIGTSNAEAATTTQTALTQLLSAVPNALQGLASPTASALSPAPGSMEWAGLAGVDFTSPAGMLNFLAGADGSAMGAFLNDNLLNTIFSSGFYMPGNFLGTMTDLAGMATAGAAADVGADAAAEAGSVGGGLISAVSPSAAPSSGGALSAGLSQASSVGGLSVPYAWTTAAPEIRFAAAALPSGGLGAVPAVAAGADASVLSQAALAGMAGRAMSGTSMAGTSMGISAAKNRPLPIVIVKPPQSGVD